MAGTTASIRDPAKAVTKGVVPKVTIDAEVKCEPPIVSMKLPKPGGTWLGLKELIIGSGGLMVKGTLDDFPPDVTTVMGIVASLLIKLAGTTAVI